MVSKQPSSTAEIRWLRQCLDQFPSKGGTEVDYQVAAPTESSTPNLHRATIAQQRVRMEGWRQRRLGSMGTIWKKKKWKSEEEEKKKKKKKKGLTLTGLMEGICRSTL